MHSRSNGCADGTGEGVACDVCGEFRVQGLNAAHAPTQHDHFGVEGVHNVRQAASQAVDIALPGVSCGVSTCCVWRWWSTAKAGPLTQVSMQPCCEHQHAGAFNSSCVGQGSGLCPHSPAKALRPVQICVPSVMPAPQPVPKMAANATCVPADAPSTASLTAKQLASFSTRTAQPSAFCTSV